MAIWSYLGNIVLTLKRLDAAYGCNISFENSNGSLGNAGYDQGGAFEIVPSTDNNLVLKLKREGSYGCAIDFQNNSGRIGLLEAKEDGHLYWKNELIK